MQLYIKWQRKWPQSQAYEPQSSDLNDLVNLPLEKCLWGFRPRGAEAGDMEQSEDSCSPKRHSSTQTKLLLLEDSVHDSLPCVSQMLRHSHVLWDPYCTPCLQGRVICWMIPSLQAMVGHCWLCLGTEEWFSKHSLEQQFSVSSVRLDIGRYFGERARE